jgi:hypothetical protein
MTDTTNFYNRITIVENKINYLYDRLEATEDLNEIDLIINSINSLKELQIN